MWQIEHYQVSPFFEFITVAVNKIEFYRVFWTFLKGIWPRRVIKMYRLREASVVGKAPGLQTARRVTVDIYTQLEKFYLPEKKTIL